MSLFEEQINQRKKYDRDAFEDSCLRIAGSVMGKKLSAALNDERNMSMDAVEAILKYYHVKKREIPDELLTFEEILEYLLRPSGIFTRQVKLTKGWRNDAFGAMLTTFAGSGQPVALIPRGIKGYKYLEPFTGSVRSVSKVTEAQFSDEAIVFYKPFPNVKLGIRELYTYIFENIGLNSVLIFHGFVLLATLIGAILPFLSKSLFSDVVPSEQFSALIAASVFMFSASLGKGLFGIIQKLYLKNISIGINIQVESATMMRVLSLPTSFFKEYSSGDLAMRVGYMKVLVEYLVEMGLAGLVTFLYSFVYIFQLFSFSPALAWPGFCVTVLVLLVDIMTIHGKARIRLMQMSLETKESGLSVAIISGVEKIRLSGAEKRAFAKWGKSYAEQAELLYCPPFFIKVSNVIADAIPLIGLIVIYYSAIKTGVTVGEFYAFNTAFGFLNGAYMALQMVIEPLSLVRPSLEMVKPITETLPEVTEEKTVVKKLYGAIELSHVSFRYKENMPMILNNLNLKIKPGQYVAITGKTGCGKSTLLRLLLGFEKPLKGAVYYDGRNLDTLNIKSVRSKIGTVLQNSQLFPGDIFTNIVATNTGLTMDDAWEAAELVKVADDIREMPMQMSSMISDGGGGISGGQRQRLMIARAIVSKPKILMFDEATSALDNITQRQVSESLDRLKCTRLVIAHRLSTVKNCDRIIVLDEGRIVEDGTYEELMEKNGIFADLFRRQMVE
ncbi:ABC-type bacteriocin/antibiotic exporter [Lachnospiraceae bacterium JC7]|nr:ABC-type bacteriocin/antibiotic exporter [Lachnospiraceae bacterium JC7]